MKRRTILWCGAALAVGASTFARPAQAPGQERKIYRDYTQRELDDAYSDAKWAPNMQELLARQKAAGIRIRSLHPPRTASYGAGIAEKLDIFVPRSMTTRRQAMIFLHGGNWRFGSQESVSCMAPTFIGHGAIFIAPEFDSIPRNTLAGMVSQCRRAIAWVGAHADELGVDGGRIYVGGHSAGGHLATMMLTTDWRHSGMSADILKGGLVLSGLCDLEPAALAAGNRHLKLSSQERIDLSPVHKLRDVRYPVLVAWGSGDSPEFRRLGSVMADHLRAAGRLAGTYSLDDVNHFEILDVLGSGQSHLAAATLALMR